MATRTLESRFEHISIQDEIDAGDGTKLYSKAKVGPVCAHGESYDV